MGRHTPAPLASCDNTKKGDLVGVFTTIGDTTWRLFLPTIGATFVGIIFDYQLGTKPWLMLCGVVCGAITAVVLVGLQLRRVWQDV